MAIKLHRPRTVAGIFDIIEQLYLSSDSFMFRGQSKEGYRLVPTLARHTRNGFTELAIKNMDQTLNQFFNHLASVGKLPDRFRDMTRRTKLEYARHYGLPSPLIDFSRSPYIALWMAINGMRPWVPGKAIVYALNINGLGILWQKHRSDPAALDQFRSSERVEIFSTDYPVNMLQFVELPSSWNTRMLRQMGTFVYDSLQYGSGAKFMDLEDFIEKGVDPPGPDGDNFTLHKIVVPYSFVKDVLQRLEIMGINGTRLLDNHEGAVADVSNSYVWRGFSGTSHDIG